MTPPEIRVSPRRPGLRSTLVNWLPGAALLVPAAILGLVGWLSWRAALSDAFQQIVRSAEATAEYGDRALEGYVVAAGRVNDRLRGLGDDQLREREEPLHHELARLLAETSSAALAYAIDRNGVPLVSSSTYPVPRGSLADRDYFQAMSGPARPPVFLSSLFHNRFDGRLLFAIARPRAGSGDPPDGDGFEGAVLVSIAPEALADSMRRIAVAPDYLGLVREDGQTLVRTAGPQMLFPRVNAGSPFYGVVARGEVAATYMGTNQRDGSAALMALRRLDHFPAYAAALRPRDAVVAAWRRTMASHLLFGVPATLALFALSLLARANQLRLAEANIALRGDARRSETRLQRAERMGLFGSFEIDLRSGENFRSPEYMAVQGLPPVARLEGHQDWLRRLHPEDRDRAERVMLDAVAPGSTGDDYAQTYRIVTPEGQVKWIAARAEIERDANGLALAMRGAHVDVTSLREAERALADSDARLRLAQEAAGIGTWEWQADDTVRLSRRMMELWGYERDGAQPGMLGFLARIHPDHRERLLNERQAAVQSGLLQMECRIVRPSQGGDAVVWIMLRASAQQESAGPRLVGIGYDVSDRKRAEAEARLLAHEVEHRAKNVLSVVTGLLRVTEADTVQQFAAVMEERVRALSRSMTLLGRNGFRGVDLRALLEDELAPYGPAVTLGGEAVMLSAMEAQPLSMALHELATNAVKYGALSRTGGGLHIAWTLSGATLHLTWEERGGPILLAEPANRGFGSTLISEILTEQLSGAITREWRGTGLFCAISLELLPPGGV